jgi:catechol 2,3-dioxygenase-like lactoylglutathione lyase family enzyme
MIGYVTVGTNDFERAAGFYDSLLADLGAKRVMELDSFIMWGAAPDTPWLALAKPSDGNAATVGNGVMIALNAENKEAVDALHRRALELGGTDEGAPGPRGDGFYAAYFRDLDGNKLNAFVTG